MPIRRDRELARCNPTAVRPLFRDVMRHPTPPLPLPLMRCIRASALLTLFGALLACAGTPNIAGAATFTVGVVRDIPIATIADPSVTLDVWQRRGARRTHLRPVALLVHGGGWHTGDKRQWEGSRWAQRLVLRGWVVVNVNYRMACGVTAPAVESPALLVRAGWTAKGRNTRLCGHPMRRSIADVRGALRFTTDRAAAWGGDPNRIVLFGASAGAQLAMIAASDDARPNGVRAVVAISPPTDLESVGQDPGLPIHASAVQSIGCGPNVCPAAWRAASPLSNVRRAVTPPTWMFNAVADPITPISAVRAYARRLDSVGIAAVLATTADANETCHGPIPCAGQALAGTTQNLFEQSQAWLSAQVR